MTTQEFVALRALITPQDNRPLHKIWKELRPCMLKICNNLGFPQEQYQGEAYLCLVSCIDRWDPSKKGLYSYAGWRLKAYLAEVRRKESLVIPQQRDYKKGKRCNPMVFNTGLMDEMCDPSSDELSLDQ